MQPTGTLVLLRAANALSLIYPRSSYTGGRMPCESAVEWAGTKLL
jgi:hypothetical protein